MVLVCHVILRDQVTKSLSNFKRRVPLEVSHHSVKFGGHTYDDIGDIMVLVFYVISQDHGFMCVTLSIGSPQGKLPSCPVWWP